MGMIVGKIEDRGITASGAWLGASGLRNGFLLLAGFVSVAVGLIFAEPLKQQFTALGQTQVRIEHLGALEPEGLAHPDEFPREAINDFRARSEADVRAFFDGVEEGLYESHLGFGGKDDFQHLDDEEANWTGMGGPDRLSFKTPPTQTSIPAAHSDGVGARTAEAAEAPGFGGGQGFIGTLPVPIGAIGLLPGALMPIDAGPVADTGSLTPPATPVSGEGSGGTHPPASMPQDNPSRGETPVIIPPMIDIDNNPPTGEVPVPAPLLLFPAGLALLWKKRKARA
ncbi:MAG: hypothetical protein AAF788_07350 [Pseudomonadota bacterium]